MAVLLHLQTNLLRKHFNISWCNETSQKQSAKWNYCGCILIHKAIGSLHEKLYHHKSMENKTFTPWKKNAWRMLIPFISHNLWFYFLPPVWFGSWQDTWFEWQLLLPVSRLYRKVQIKRHETLCWLCLQQMWIEIMTQRTISTRNQRRCSITFLRTTCKFCYDVVKQNLGEKIGSSRQLGKIT